jgi:hypothetical protein
MISIEEAVQTLLDVARGTYSPGASYSCVKEFTQDFPNREPRPFVPDGPIKQIGGS